MVQNFISKTELQGMINKRKDLSNSITKIIDTLNEMGVEE